MKTTDFDYIRNYVRARAAIVIEPGKEYLVESRLAVLARREKFATIDALVEVLRSDARHPLHRKVLDVMTTNETSFFRDIHPFEALKKHIIPELKERHASTRTLNFWCGAASTGQECYSVLMTLAEHHPDIFNTWKLNFIATDLSQDVLEQAVAGRYTQLEVNRGLPAPMLIKYFKRNGDFWFVDERLRAKVMFRELNLIADWPLAAGFDVVFLRNVLIYFDLDIKRQILTKIRRLLRPGGVLFLGSAETTLGIDDNFERVVHDRATCYRNPG